MTQRTLPKGWKMTSLAEVISNLETGSRPKGGAVGISSGIPSLSAEHMTNFGTFDFSELRYVPQQFYEQMSRGHIQHDDILIVKDGATTGKTTFVEKDFPFKKAVVNEHVFICRLNSEVAHPKYVFYFLWGKDGQKQIKQSYQGAAIGGINQRFVEKVYFPLPPLEEQKRIAARLDEQMRHIEGARLAAEESLSAAWELPSAYLREVFEGKEAKRWGNQKLGEVSKIVGGVQKTPDRAPTNFHKPYLTVRNVQKGYLDLSQVERFEVTPNEFERCKLKQGDILIVEGNGSIDHIGRNALFELPEDDWIHQNHIIRVRLDSSFNPKFVSLFLNSPLGRSQMIEKAETTSGLYTLSSGKVASLEIPTPSLDEQQKIVDGLNKKLAVTNEMQTSLESQLAEIESLPSAVLGQAFAGGV